MKFKVLGGQHEHHGKLYKEGDVLECEKDMTKIFRNKFEKVEDTTPSSEVEDTSTELDPSGNGEKDSPPPGQDPRGKDVTDAFPLALEEDLVVIRNGKWCSVYEQGAKDALNDKGLQKKEVQAFLEKYLEG